ncbi:type I-D CRISPR-associated protein Cas7/Csc2 [Prochlorothrix hollandica]|uniref:CRISPR-associated protein Csc2 n=1 Tax=Prochlorothrix hollandica PCC 9006 = CALU 1027 TaxID=317619 RepID=A0A0M2PZ70_PROHO|nr:type I-D CRISPR-associated protein Cas7/Csc2 [Prochlorothrix hollandica]KKJ01450.1 CRISPR-associated protein Csc2 [Prochlorothrix hollandica PCC 9006 = CALU 1027]
MSFDKLQPFLAPSYENFPKGRTIGTVILRTTQSETIFRTEGSGEPLCSEYVAAGVSDSQIIPRLVMTKRKQIAPERRKGREFLRAFDLLRTDTKTNSLCSLNTNAPCEMCIDCFLYGFAAGGGGAQKSRVWTEDAFSVLSATELVGDRTINAIYENGTMRLKKDESNESKASTALNTSEYIKPGVHFLDVVTFKDVTADELRYGLGNILLTTRYGAVSSRVGRMDNQILGIFGGIAELPSSLELVQGVYDQLVADLQNKPNGPSDRPEHPFSTATLTEATQTVLASWIHKRGITVQLTPDELTALIADLDQHLEPDHQEAFLRRLDQSYESLRHVNPDQGKKKSKNQAKAAEQGA